MYIKFRDIVDLSFLFRERKRFTLFVLTAYRSGPFRNAHKWSKTLRTLKTV
jgi:hypothetical protein